MLKPVMILCDRYEILDTVGAGGMSIVYKAKCHRLNRNVAIKVLKPEFSNDKNFVSKFKIEAQASAGLSHPNIVNVYDVYDDDGIYFIVMELVDGITLKEYIQQYGRLSMDKAIDFSIQIASGLEAAHESHIIHRDIKPQNIIVSKNGNVKVTDFGIAKAATSNTLTSSAMGSVHYISPEQARGGYSDERSDIYSLGITMYEMVTGRVPFEGDNNVSVALMHIQSEMIPPRQYYPDIYSSFEKVILKATQKKPERRYLTASALIADLKRVQNNPNIDIIVAPTAISNSPTQEWTKEDVQAIRDGSALKDPYSNSQLNEFDNTPVPNETGDIQQIGGYVQPPVNSKLQQLLYEEEDEWDDYEEEYVEPARKTGGIKKVQDYDDDEEEYNDGGDIDPGLRKAVTIAGIATAVIIAIVALVILGNVMGWFKFGHKDNKTTVEEGAPVAMIDVKGYSEEAAVKMLKDLGFTNIKIEYVEDTDTDPGYVIEANFKKNDMVKPDEEIILKVAADAEEIPVPDVTGYDDNQAVKVLEEKGFTIQHAYENDDEIEKDKVIRTEPEANAKAKKGDMITIVLSNGAEIKEVSVPNLSNMTEVQAINELAKVKLNQGTVTHSYSDTVKEGFVISQNPASGSKAKEGDQVSFVISDGPEPKAKTYTANAAASVSGRDATYDGQAVTIQLYYGGELVREAGWTVSSGSSYNISGAKTGLADKNGAVSVTIIDAAGVDVTNQFNVSPSVSYSEE